MLMSPARIASKISSRLFDYNREAGVFTAEASELPRFKLSQIFDDACDEGFAMVSARTGSLAVFVLLNQDDDVNGDILCWNFQCVTPGLKNLRAVIFND